MIEKRSNDLTRQDSHFLSSIIESIYLKLFKIPTLKIPRVNSTSSFYWRRSQKRKKTVKLSVFFALLGSARAKAALRTLIKLTPDVEVSIVMLPVFESPEVKAPNLRFSISKFPMLRFSIMGVLCLMLLI